MIDHTAVVAVVQIQTNLRDKDDIFAATRQVKEMSSSWNIVKLGLNLIPILTTIYLKTSVTERGRDRPHSCCRCGSNSDKSAGQG